MSTIGFYYVYILQSIAPPSHFYVGFTENIRQRLAYHNDGQCPHTAKFRPWKIKTCVAFTYRPKALEFERLRKSDCEPFLW